jgi:RNA polymerase sigma-70 factor, ECF subfamily
MLMGLVLLESPARAPRYLMADAAPTDPLAPATLVARYGERLYRLARRLTGNDPDAEDVTQSTLLKVLQRAADFRGESDPFGWIYRIALNEARELHRRRARRPAVSLDALPLEMHEDGHFAHAFRPPPRLPDSGAVAHEVETRVREAIDELPDAYREAVVLVDLEGLGYAEAARLMDLKLGAFKTRLHRARLHLRNRLEQLWDAQRDAAAREDDA